MWNKYCKKYHPTITRNTGVSQMEENGGGNSSFWYDNWTKQGALYFTEEELAIEEEIEVKEFQSGGDWNINKLLE
ncbi:hypothetical protein H5410_046723 [Solanum commersonii]|uniref:Uncharacterized protein n=1 Tax=Solanum commersonii TaxID=4109 RepID=A0A9J5XD23_SOLCO|nr:hypothetical protein H5410_046723 [Solanum commersonii]